MYREREKRTHKLMDTAWQVNETASQNAGPEIDRRIDIEIVRRDKM